MGAGDRDKKWETGGRERGRQGEVGEKKGTSGSFVFTHTKSLPENF